MYRERGRSLRGEQIIGEISGKKFERTSIIAGKCGSKILAPFAHKNTTNSELFNMWLEKILLPETRKGQVIIMDNATFHKSKKTRELIENAGCILLYLPPYSPDLNKIEYYWGVFKKTLRSVMSNFANLYDAIYSLFVS
jgi:transposase